MFFIFFLIGILATINYTRDLTYKRTLDNYNEQGLGADTGSLLTMTNIYPELDNAKIKYFLSAQEKELLENISKEITKDCNDDYCIIKKSFEYVTISDDGFVYDVGASRDIKLLVEEHEGDCDELSYVLMGLLKVNNIDSRIQCSTYHCWLIVKHNIKGFDTKFVIDPAGDYMRMVYPLIPTYFLEEEYNE